ncbi:hypothetical protein [Anabaena sp. UHCC 0399]|uniref:hypothetical protein n=1 Tax=Anabaena sp. UHCC 0399 TaxID=3110238 RepID=UPI0016863A10|nr:hypothetical protein [Anabaena sp. UHCC 0399]MBD2360617.1 hypothetical protein [Anabaena minutissima FACHB-250]MEA5568220.1 hypothetical protein [Anabaena sp. UHCC 0399]
MSVKLKFFLILILSIFATAGAGVYMIQYQTAIPIVDNINAQPQPLSDVQHSQEIVEDSERAQYENIPLESVNSPLQGSDPAKLAMNLLDDFQPTKSDRQVEVTYPQPNQALVTVIQTPSQGDSSTAMKYRVEMNRFGRSLLSSSPPIWQIVWVGSQSQCQAEC